MLPRTAAVLAVSSLLVLTCNDASVSNPAGLEVFTASLTGGNERPSPVTTSATGSAIVTVLGQTVTWKVDVIDIDSANAAHIHIGGPQDAGDVARSLNPLSTGLNFTGMLANGSAPIEDSVVALMRAGRTYVNVHTLGNPGGEIRGQLRKP
ncbi:MAG TPA: CHRD domain-containing protein [Gemmatimonadales bacterium]|nr:CHRD domain-containing protein [Gemmatimonadales bacterium]